MNKQPEDLMLMVLVRALIVVTASKSQVVFLIDRDYEIRQSFTRNEFGIRQATKARAQLLNSGELLAVVATGYSTETDHHVVCEHYPGPGVVQTYDLAYPKPTPEWVDPTNPDAQYAIEAFREFWSIDALKGGQTLTPPK